MDENPYRAPEAAQERRPSVKIKAYGLIPMTRKTYLIVQGVLLVLAIGVLFLVRLFATDGGQFFSLINDHLVTIVVVVLALEGLETVLMLSRFKKAERAGELAADR